MVREWKKAGMSFAVTALVLVFALPVWAQGWDKPVTSERVYHDRYTSATFPTGHWMGMDVTAQNGDHLGKVDDLIVTRDGRVRDVVISLDSNNKLVEVPFHDVRFTKDHIVFKGSRAELASMPGPERVYGYYSSDRGYYANRNYTSRETPSEKRYDMNKPDTYGHYGHWAPTYQKGYYDLGYWPNATGNIPPDAPTYPPSSTK